MIRARVEIQDRALKELQAGLNVLPVAVDRYIRREVVPFVRQEVTKRLRRAPGRPRYPLRWKSAKQRRYWFAVLAVYNVQTHEPMAYQRTGGMEQGWSVTADYTNGLSSISITNKNSASRWVYGDEDGKDQQPFHKDTGWPLFADVRADLSVQVNNRIAQGLVSVFEQASRGRMK